MWSEAFKLIGGLLAVVVGLATLCAIALVAIGVVSSDNQSVVAIATSSFGVIGTIVGAYFGVKVGSDGTQRAVDAMRGEAAKAQAFAAYLPTDMAEKALQSAQSLVQGSPKEEKPGV
jgi:hypothetical protein